MVSGSPKAPGIAMGDGKRTPNEVNGTEYRLKLVTILVGASEDRDRDLVSLVKGESLFDAGSGKVRIHLGVWPVLSTAAPCFGRGGPGVERELRTRSAQGRPASKTGWPAMIHKRVRVVQS